MTAPEHDDLPLRDYDHLPLSAVAQRIRSLTVDQIGQLLDYEHAHAARPAVEQLMQVRRAELRAGAEPTGGREQTGPDWYGSCSSLAWHLVCVGVPALVCLLSAVLVVAAPS